jgi:hypothetical protein
MFGWANPAAISLRVPAHDRSVGCMHVLCSLSHPRKSVAGTLRVRMPCHRWVFMHITLEHPHVHPHIPFYTAMSSVYAQHGRQLTVSPIYALMSSQESYMAKQEALSYLTSANFLRRLSRLCNHKHQMKYHGKSPQRAPDRHICPSSRGKPQNCSLNMPHVQLDHYQGPIRPSGDLYRSGKVTRDM